MNNDQNLIAEAYRRIYLEADTDFRDQMPSSAEVYEPEVERKELQKQLQDKSWLDKVDPIGHLRHAARIGVQDGRVFAVWEDRYSDGDRYYYDHYVVYKDEGKVHDVDEDQYNKLVDLSLSQQ
jgi:hypothetical protein